jgi:hypothetical protein
MEDGQTEFESLPDFLVLVSQSRKTWQVEWEEPTDRVHRAVNVGMHAYERVTVFCSTARTRCLSQARNSIDRHGVYMRSPG